MKRFIRLRIFVRLPLEVVILAAVACPRIERIDDMRELGLEPRNRPLQDALSGDGSTLLNKSQLRCTHWPSGPLFITHSMPTLL
jgi:hypothetical protein